MAMVKVDRREFMVAAAASVVTAAVPWGAAAQEKPSLVFSPLPYAANSLEPWISARTVELHYAKHHRAYFDLVTQYIADDPSIQKLSLEQIIRATHGGINMKEAQFQMSVLLWNHNFYWKSMRPGGGGPPEAKLRIAKMISASFGSFDGMKKQFVEEAMKHGVGWVWLLQSGQGLTVGRTDYHDSPLVHEERTPLLTCDVWEHAYYLDYQYDRGAYINAFLDRLANWQFAESNLKPAKK